MVDDVEPTSSADRLLRYQVNAGRINHEVRVAGQSRGWSCLDRVVQGSWDVGTGR